MWFVYWAKTGSNEGIEVGFLLNCTSPLSKSQIQSFAQLNPGDAIVKKDCTFSHYYRTFNLNINVMLLRATVV